MFINYISWFGTHRIIAISIIGLILSITELANIGIFISYINSFGLEKNSLLFFEIFKYEISLNFILFISCMILGALIRIKLFNYFRKTVRDVTKDVLCDFASSSLSGLDKQRAKLVYVNQGVRSSAEICTGFCYCTIGIVAIMTMVQADFVIISGSLIVFFIVIILYYALSLFIFSKVSGALNKELEEVATAASHLALNAAKSATDHQASINMKNQAVTILVQNGIFALLGLVMLYSEQLAVIDILGLVLMVSRLSPKFLELLRGINVLISIRKVVVIEKV